MTRMAVVLVFVLALSVTHLAAAAPPYEPPGAEQVSNYFSRSMPCKIVRESETIHRAVVRCENGLLETKTLRELSILRNTIYARYGWSRFRKPWLREYFKVQPWFHPNPGFSYKLISEVDRQNAHLIGTFEAGLTKDDLFRYRTAVYARHGRIWNDKPKWEVKGKIVVSCTEPKGYAKGDDYEDDARNYYHSHDCYSVAQPWFHPNPNYSDNILTADDRVELGLIDLAEGAHYNAASPSEPIEKTLDQVLRVDVLRQLSLRDLRFVRNAIYARRGRRFKSEILQEYFELKDWYEADPKYTDAKLTKTDQRNIALIRSVENEFGGPISDEEHLIEPNVDGA